MHRALAVMLMIAFAGTGATGCAQTISFVSYEPGLIEPRGARRFVIVEGEGKRGARDQVADILAEELHGGWYKVSDRSEGSTRLVLSGKRAKVVPDTARIGDDDLWLRADVIGWRLGPAVDEARRDDGTVVITPLVRAEVVLQFTIADEDGRVLLREHEFAGVADATIGPALLERDLLDTAARQAVGQFVASVEPQRVSWRLELDDSDDGQKVILQGIKQGAIGTARKQLERYVKAHKKNAAAHYNLAVLLDAQGSSRRALDHYDRALELGARDFYFPAREGCARRAAALDALYGAPPPKKKRPAADDDDEADKKGTPRDAPGTAPPAP